MAAAGELAATRFYELEIMSVPGSTRLFAVRSREGADVSGSLQLQSFQLDRDLSG